MSRLSPTVPTMVSRAVANALINSKGPRRLGSPMRVADLRIPKCRSLVSRNCGSMVQRRA